MSRSQSLLLLIAMSIDIVHSWDVAITSGNQMEFYSNQNKTGSEGAQFRDLTALAYDAVHSMLFFVDKQSDNASIFSYNLATKKYQSLVRKRPSDNIQGVAFDPVTGLLFWTDFTERSIFYISLMRDSKNDIYGNLSIKMDDELPRAIAVDSCRGYIYWTNTNNTKPTIERARFDGKERTVIVNTNIFMPVSLAIDQQTKRLYWADDKEGIHYSIESSDLDGKDRVTLLSGTDHYPNSMTVSKDSIFWVDWGFKKVWTIPKIPTNDIEPKEYIAFKNKPFGIVANYTIEDQFENASECRKLSSHFKENKTYINDTFSVPPDAGLFCVHGVKVIDKLECKCTAGYTGDRCDISVCKNYCFKGHCTFTAEGNPMCSCSEGVTGDRCEKEVCYNYCLNNGICKINEGNKPVCLCSRDFEGSRCENVKPIPTTSNSLPTTTRTTKETQSLPKTEDSRSSNEQFADKKCETELCYNYCLNNGTCTINEKQDAVCTCFRDFEGLRCENVKPIPSTTANRAVRTTKETQILSNPEVSCNCTKEETATKIASSDNSGNLNKDDIFEESSCNDGWDTFSHPAFIVLGITCGLLSVACVVLITKIMQLKKRPRIKKRIIVNKNVTPLTARPDQCEITIENCCNMNICETPCFEPRSTIRATLINSKPGKEEKRNLISNMECPEDY